VSTVDIDELFEDGNEARLLSQVLAHSLAAAEAVQSNDAPAAAAAVSAEAAVLAKALALGRMDVAVAATRGLAAAYATPNAAVPIQIEIGTALSALGGLAVRLEEWSYIRRLALLPSGVRVDSYDQPYLLPHSRIHVARSGSRVGYEPSLIEAAKSWAAEHDDAHPDLPLEDERILDSICQFNALATVIQFTVDKEFGFPEFRRYEPRRTDRVIETLVTDPDVRRQLLRGETDHRVATILTTVGTVWSEWFVRYGVWDGFGSKRVKEFVTSNRSAS
jgi:hypothetical protein